MRRKPVPPAPESVEYLREVRDAVSLVPREEESCCLRLMDRAGVPAEDEARTWLTFLQALDLVSETGGKFVRDRDPTDPGRDDLAERFREGVYGVRELAGILDREGPLDADAAFEAFREHVPQWERHHEEDWEATWRERVRRLLEWGTLLGVFGRTDGEYRA